MRNDWLPISSPGFCTCVDMAHLDNTTGGFDIRKYYLVGLLHSTKLHDSYMAWILCNGVAVIQQSKSYSKETAWDTHQRAKIIFNIQDLVGN